MITHDGNALPLDASREHSIDGPGLLSVRGLTVEYRSRRGVVRALDDLSFDLRPGERIGVAGESGSGKSTMGLALMRLLDPRVAATSGSVVFNGQDLLTADQKTLQAIRGPGMSMIFQDAMTALDPVRTVGSQVIEGLRAHRKLSKKDAVREAISLLDEAEIPEPARRVRQYPHELSGGLRQRAMVAVSLASSPQLLIADEATSALDVTTQAGVLAMLERLCARRQMSVIFISHDLGVLAGFTERVLVLYAGRAMERGTTRQMFGSPAHPYTRALIGSIPRIDEPRLQELRSIPGNLTSRTLGAGCPFEPRCQAADGREECRTVLPTPTPTPQGSVAACHFPYPPDYQEIRPRDPAQETAAARPAEVDRQPLAELQAISKQFPIRRQGGRKQPLHALREVSLTINAGESLGVVGESGSGKTTLGRVLVGLLRADGGTLAVADNLRSSKGGRSKRHRRPWHSGDVQMIFQDPGSSLNPLLDIQSIVVEPLVVTIGGSGRRHRDRAAELIELVGLPADVLPRRPFELSGGQRQRVAIARSICTSPSLVVADEAVSSLDMSARGQVLNLLESLRGRMGIAFVHISHDLSMLRHVADRIVVMYAGAIVEIQRTDDLFAAPQHPYTRALINSVPVPDPDQAGAADRQPLRGDPPSLLGLTPGCPFAPRCPAVQDRCRTERPDLLADANGGSVACHFPLLSKDSVTS